METIIDLLQPEGTSRYEVLLFAHFKNERAKQALEPAMRASVGEFLHSIISYEEERVAFVDLRTSSREEVGALIVRALSATSGINDLVGALCIVEGQYAGLEDTFLDDKWAPRGVYAFCLPNDDPVLCLSMDFFRSPAWRQVIVESLRDRMRGRLALADD